MSERQVRQPPCIRSRHEKRQSGFWLAGEWPALHVLLTPKCTSSQSPIAMAWRGYGGTAKATTLPKWTFRPELKGAEYGLKMINETEGDGSSVPPSVLPGYTPEKDKQEDRRRKDATKADFPFFLS